MRMDLRRTAFLAVALLTMVTTGCKTASNTREATPAKLVDALLTVTDLESQWDQSSREVFTSRTAYNPAITNPWCPDGVQMAAPLDILVGDAGAKVAMSFKDTAVSARTLDEQAWNDENAKSYFSTIKQVVDTCDGKTWTDGSGVTQTFKKMVETSVGDEAVTFTNSLQLPDSMKGKKFPGAFRTIVMRIGNTIMILEVGDHSRSDAVPVLIADVAWTTIVETAANKIGKL